MDDMGELYGGWDLEEVARNGGADMNYFPEPVPPGM